MSPEPSSTRKTNSRFPNLQGATVDQGEVLSYENQFQTSRSYGPRNSNNLFAERCEKVSSDLSVEIKDLKLRETSNALPIGIVPRIAPSRHHYEFLHQLPDLPNIMINLDLAERLCQDGINASSFYPGGNVITTSTIHDSILAKYTVENEIDIIKTFRPRWHIPSDVPVYHEDCDEGRARFIEFFVEDTLTFIHQIKGHNIGIIPLVKGINGDEWLMSTQPFVDMGITEFAFYVRQYFGSTKGRNERLMVRDLQSLISTCEVGYLMLIGYQSNQYLTQLPPQVKCFAGERWVRNSILKKGNADSSKESYLKWNDAFFSSCGTRQTVLGSFLYAHEKEVV